MTSLATNNQGVTTAVSGLNDLPSFALMSENHDNVIRKEVFSPIIESPIRKFKVITSPSPPLRMINVTSPLRAGVNNRIPHGPIKAESDPLPSISKVNTHLELYESSKALLKHHNILEACKETEPEKICTPSEEMKQHCSSVFNQSYARQFNSQVSKPFELHKDIQLRN